jgi:endonuclease YncB( thermonuclease family)
MNLISAVLVAGHVCAWAASAPQPVVKVIELDKSKIIYDDGDTIEYTFSPEHGIAPSAHAGVPGATELRLLGYDTPEVMHPDLGIFYAQPYGPEATLQFKAFVAAALKVEAATFGEKDKYGRLLSHLILDGVPVAALMIAKGLAYEAVLFYGDNGFTEWGRQIRDAWDKSPIKRAKDAGETVPFMEPYRWRQLNQHHDRGIALDQWTLLDATAKEKAAANARELAKKKAAAPKP